MQVTGDPRIDLVLTVLGSIATIITSIFGSQWFLRRELRAKTAAEAHKASAEADGERAGAFRVASEGYDGLISRLSERLARVEEQLAKAEEDLRKSEEEELRLRRQIEELSRKVEDRDHLRRRVEELERENRTLRARIEDLERNKGQGDAKLST